MKEQIKTYLNRYVSFSDNEINEIYGRLSSQTLQKKKFLLHEGQICNHKYFIIKGLVRLFYIDFNGNEKVIQFAIENWWVTNVESFIKETPSSISIQALEETIILSIKKNELEELYQSIPKLERLFRLITENMLIAIQKRNEFYMKASSKDRYYSLINNIPNLAQRVPQYMIASYLDVTPEYLSEIRKNS